MIAREIFGAFSALGGGGDADLAPYAHLWDDAADPPAVEAGSMLDAAAYALDGSEDPCIVGVIDHRCRHRLRSLGGLHRGRCLDRPVI